MEVWAALWALTVALTVSVTAQECYQGYEWWADVDLAGQVAPLRSASVTSLRRCIQLCQAAAPNCKSFLFVKVAHPQLSFGWANT